ncbi:MAG: sigma-70 family RNA polymerase sigma factor [Sphingobium sp.]|nr:sigma-70 family RNA polymerase sigma factor [Sphingobium sp.]
MQAPAIERDSDDYLMAAVGRGDAQAYSRLVERHLAGVYRLCYRLVADRQEAEDLTQESFARLWQSAPNWRSQGGGVPAWLHRVARNLCFDRLRTRREVATGAWPDIEDLSPDAARRIETGQLQALLEACLHRLSPAHRSALVLSYYEGHSNAVAAQIMDMNLKAFESLLLRARRRMSAELVLAGVQRADVELLS